MREFTVTLNLSTLDLAMVLRNIDVEDSIRSHCSTLEERVQLIAEVSWHNSMRRWAEEMGADTTILDEYIVAAQETEGDNAVDETQGKTGDGDPHKDRNPPGIHPRRDHDGADDPREGV